jgi:pimeloyl-ACP methyl ester carboxylesterase
MEVVKLMPNAQLHEMRAGHLPLMDKPQETSRVIRAFLAKEEAVTALSPDVL